MWADTVTGMPLGGAPVVAGTYTVVATFPGSADYRSATSLPLKFIIDQATPSVTVGDGGGTYDGSPYAATALVAGVVAGIDSTPALFLESVNPTVSYYAGSLDAQQAAGATPLPGAPADVGTYTAMASFPGSTDYLLAQSRPVTFVITQNSTATAVASSPNPSTIGQTVTFTATVTPGSTTVVSPAGTVDFYDATTSTDLGTVPLVPGVNGGPSTAVLSTSALAAGMQSITATYLGNSNFSGSAATMPDVHDVQIGTGTAVSSATNPSASGQSVTFTATVTANSGTFDDGGTVQFYVDGSPYLGPVQLDSNGQACVSDAGLGVGMHAVAATYLGDTAFSGSGGLLTGGQTVTAQIATSTAVSASPNPSLLGQWVTFTATVTSNWGTFDDGGSVQFYVDGSPYLGPQPLDGNGRASVSDSSLAVGTHAIAAVYSSDAGFGGSSGTVAPLEDVQIATVTTISTTPNPSLPGQWVTLCATVTPNSGTFDDGGAVQFAVDGSNLGTPVPLNANGQASIPDSVLTVGTHTITATYSGDIDFQGSGGIPVRR